MKWRKFNGEPISLPIYDAVENAIKREVAAGYNLKVCIGTDSQVKGSETEFATVIVFLREGHGGFMCILSVRIATKQFASMTLYLLISNYLMVINHRMFRW